MNTFSPTLVVGSRCIPELKRRPKDLDVITTQAGFDEMVARAGLYDQLKEIRFIFNKKDKGEIILDRIGIN